MCSVRLGGRNAAPQTRVLSVGNQRVSLPFSVTGIIGGIEPTIDVSRFVVDHSIPSWERGWGFIFSCPVTHISDTGQRSQVG